jgi:hypothetical protein
MVYPHIQYRGPAYPDGFHGSAPTTPRELDSRSSDGIHVRLLWSPSDSDVSAYAADRGARPTESGPAADVALGVRATL